MYSLSRNRLSLTIQRATLTKILSSVFSSKINWFLYGALCRTILYGALCRTMSIGIYIVLLFLIERVNFTTEVVNSTNRVWLSWVDIAAKALTERMDKWGRYYFLFSSQQLNDVNELGFGARLPMAMLLTHMGN